MSATLLDGRGRTIRTVRNLGWLLRNSGHVELITIVPIRPVRGVDRGEVRMIVSLDALAPPPAGHAPTFANGGAPVSAGTGCAINPGLRATGCAGARSPNPARLTGARRTLDSRSNPRPFPLTGARAFPLASVSPDS